MESQKSLGEDWFLWLLLVAAVALTAGYYWYVFLPEDEGDSSPQWVLNGVDRADVRSIRKYSGDTLAFSVERSADTGWEVPSLSEVTLERSSVENWLESLLAPDVQRRFRSSPEADYGLSRRSQRIGIQLDDRRHELRIGATTPTGQGFYVRSGTSNDGSMYVLPSRDREDLIPDLFDLRDKSLFERSEEELESFSLLTESDSVTYRRSGKRWLIASGRNTTLSETGPQNLDDSVGTLLTTTAGSFYDTDVPDAFESSHGEILLRFRGENRTIALGGEKANERLIRIDDGPVVGVTRDPVRVLGNLPVKPDGWPEVSDPTEPPSSKKTPSPEELQNLPERMQQSPGR